VIYEAPVNDYRFLLLDVFDVERIIEMASGGEVSLDDALEILGYAGTFAAEAIAPLNAIGDRVGSQLREGRVASPSGFVEAYRTFAEGGWVGIAAAREFGGGGLPRFIGSAASEFWSAASMAFALCPGLTQSAIVACETVADDQLKELYLRPLIAGRWTGTMDMTEPQAGTDLAAIRTLARPQEDGSWAVTGQKIFITWGDHDLAENIVHLVLARTPDAPAGLAGLSLFLVPTFTLTADGELGERNSLQTVSLEHKLGIHASPTCVLSYEGATGHLLGEVNGGLAAMFVMMNAARLGIGTQALGLSDRAYQSAAEYASDRVQGRVAGRPASSPIAEHPDVGRLLLSMRSTITAMRALCVQVSVWLDLASLENSASEDALADFFVPILKGWCSENSVQIASDAVQVHGGVGFIEEAGVAQLYRDARILPIYEGTTAAQANDLLMRKVLRDQGDMAGQVLDLIALSASDLAEREHPVARRVAEKLETAIDAMRTATRLLLEPELSPRDVLAVAVPYLTQFGVLAGGWMHARILNATLVSSAGDSAATAERLSQADFYATHRLTQLPSLIEIVKAGEIAVADPVPA
jgi:hypothetical protein